MKKSINNQIKLTSCVAILLLACAAGLLQAQVADTSEVATSTAPISTQTTDSQGSDEQELPAGDSAPSGAQPSQLPTSELEAPIAVLSDESVISNLFTGYIDALGGERRLRKIQSRVVKGSIESGETKADFELHQSGEGHFLSVKQLPGNTKRVGYDGEIAWEQTGEAKWTELSETDAANERFFGSLTGFLDWQSFYTKKTLLPDIEINGRPVKVVLAETDSGISQKIFFDKQNFRVVRVDEEIERGDEGRVKAEHYFRDYRTVNNVVVPFLEETILPNTTLTKRIRSVEQNVFLEDGIFSPPRNGQIAKSGGRDIERYFDRLTVSGVVYTNVWVHRQTNFNVLIRHAQGIHTIRLTDLPQGDLDELRPQLGDLANIEKDKNIVTDKWQELTSNTEFQEQAKESLAKAQKLAALFLIPIIAVAVVLFFCWSYILKRLCDKTQTKGGLAVWLPLAQLWPMNRAAGISDLWTSIGLLLVILPVVAMSSMLLYGMDLQESSGLGLWLSVIYFVGLAIYSIISLIWPFKICSRCKKSPLLGLLMFVPGLNVLTLAYVAFSKDE